MSPIACKPAPKLTLDSFFSAITALGHYILQISCTVFRQRLMRPISYAILAMWSTLFSIQAMADLRIDQLSLVPAPTELVIPDAEVLTLSPEFRQVLDSQIKVLHRPSSRVLALHELLFGPDGYNVQYHGAYTRTAMETLNWGSGNCVSLANLYVAAARYVGLQAYFQESQVPEDWQESAAGYYVVPGHVNVLVKLRGHRDFTVEFLSAYEGRGAKTRVLSDEEAIAQYYNNLGMKYLQQDKLALSYAFSQKALSLYDASPLLWSNRGVIEKHMGNLALAEQAYLESLRLDAEFLSAAKNLYVLYLQTGEEAKAQRFSEKIEAYNRRNPYYLEKLALTALGDAAYDDAIDLLKKAIKIKKTEDRFHFALAKAYYYSGDIERASGAMAQAQEVADTAQDKQRYQGKLAALAQIAHR